MTTGKVSLLKKMFGLTDWTYLIHVVMTANLDWRS